MSAQILYMISVNKKLAGKAHLSSRICPFRNQANIYRGWKTKKSSGLDGISNQLLKWSLPCIIDKLTYVFNLRIEKNVFPSELKKAEVVPLPKSADKTNPTNYRPTSLLSVLSKLLEKHVHVYLNDYLEKWQLLHPFQSGFRRKYSCNTVLARFTNSWLTAMNKSEVSGVAFLDQRRLSTWLITTAY